MADGQPVTGIDSEGHGASKLVSANRNRNQENCKTGVNDYGQALANGTRWLKDPGEVILSGSREETEEDAHGLES
jgi:hypothetical protein